MLHARALEIVRDPTATEEQWLAALQVLGPRLPRQSRRGLVLVRLAKRMAMLLTVYSAIFGATSLIDALFVHRYSVYGPTHILAISLFWSTIEATTGLFTLFCVVVLLTSLPQLFVFDPVFQCIVLILAINVAAWRHPVFRPCLVDFVVTSFRCIARKKILSKLTTSNS
jgi:hypothetical protein